MATDAEESDTDERPTKRLRLGNNDRIRMDQQRLESGENSETNSTKEEEERMEIERRARERLKKWQARHVAKGFMDNTINHVLEDDVAAPSFGAMHSRDHLRTNDMEDRAVTMAIRNHGLVQPSNFLPDPDPPSSSDNLINNYWIGEREMQLRCTCPLNVEQNRRVDDVTGLITSSEQAFGRSKPDEGHDCWIGDKGDENNQQQDFLERAVAEAIKKKGLSALSVDYG
ncbi:uncharacterized protein LOC105691890 [Athalia rosae]|uniref:uncharacterized protein LOC105691890 n=1 Tax=Athalia rosae TaxID=37344 RepID=UPI0020336431|nr:uncharacterized protein LOC105691890 [Athalia rosae]XP_048507981.1 uncharacterized protein LOC105691890 [Athalia rosae]